MNSRKTEEVNEAKLTDNGIMPFADKLHSMTEQDERLLLSAPAPVPGGAGFRGELLACERRNVTLNIVQKMGSLVDTFRVGAIVLNKEVELSDGSQDVELTILHIHKFYQEKVAYNSGVRPKTFDTLEEVKRNGGTIEWINDEAPSYESVLRCTVLVKKPDGVDGGFTLSHGDHSYTLAEWYIRGVAFKTVGISLLSTIWQMKLSGHSFSSVKWKLCTSRHKLNNGHSLVVPVLKNAGPHTDEFAEFTASLMA